MAKIEFINPETEHEDASVEVLEVVVWGSGGQSWQGFEIGGGGNFDASTNFWLEVRYTVQGLPICYTRNAFSHSWDDVCAGQLERLAQFEHGEVNGFGFGDMLPETSLTLLREFHTYQDANGEEQTDSSYHLEIALDLGAVFGHSAPGERMLKFSMKYIEIEAGLRFMRELVTELEDACRGLHPDPGSLPPGHSEWPFAVDLNRRAYDRIASEYHENYFTNPMLTATFDDWLGQLVPGGQVLDLGCGHGDPVITRLLERGFKVTGSDLSSAMLARARERFPDVSFWELASTQITAREQFDGICSFSSALYLDEIDFFHSVHRLYLALKPGGLLFLYGFDLHPTWRGQPYDFEMGNWMWGGTRARGETARALEEHGYFTVLQSMQPVSDEERQAKIAAWRERTQKEHDQWLASLPPEYPAVRTDYSTIIPDLALPYVVIARKNGG